MMLTEHFLRDARKCIEYSKNNNKECGFSFNETDNTTLTYGETDSVLPRQIENKIGTFHVHTIVNSKPSEYDVATFLNEPKSVRYMCLAIPTEIEEEEWKISCYDRDITVVDREYVYI